ncbi:hypothetical protein C1646_819300 [Rhizophagus diaphanus]|nr:hypothetical protein C1646_819300 [Rhizophagus diaphanus] [Rhizophagus sp. MUCL 43196]
MKLWIIMRDTDGFLVNLELEGIEGVWIIPQKKKNFNKIISSGQISTSTASNKEWKSDLNVRGKDHGRENEVQIISKKDGKEKVTDVFSGSSKVNKDRPTSCGFKEIPKARLEKEKDKVGNKKAAGSSKSYEEEKAEVLEIIDRYRKKLGLNGGKTESSSKGGHVTLEEVVKVVENFQKEDKKKEKIVTRENLDLYHKVNQACSSHLSEVKKERISDDENIGQKRVNKEKLSRGMLDTLLADACV